MPYVVSENPVTLRLVGPVVLPPDEPTLVDKERWAKCRAHPITQTLMARGLVKLTPGPAKPKNAPKAAKSKVVSSKTTASTAAANSK